MPIETRFCVLLLLAILPYAAPASAQQNTPAGQAPAAVYHLDVVVTPRSGPPVSGLQQQDFTLLDNKVSQPLTAFHAFEGNQAPVEIILLIDAVNTPYSRIAYARQQIDAFLHANNGHLAHPMSLAIFTEANTQMQDVTSRDGNAISAVLDKSTIGLRSIGRSSGLYGADEHVQLSIETLYRLAAHEATRPGRKIILWVSPGWSLLTGPRIDLDRKQQAQLFAQIVNLSTALRKAHVTLYSIDPEGTDASVYGTSYAYRGFVKGISKPNDALPGDLALQVLATQTGGLALHASNDITSLLQQCIADADAYYELSFNAPPAEHSDEYHHLEIKVAKAGLTARTRQGYYSQP